MTYYELPIKEDVPSTVNGLLREWLVHGKIEAVIAMQETPSGKSAFPAMVSDPDKLNTNVFAPILPVSIGTMVSKMTRVRGSTSPIAVVLRSCELRSLVELVKLKQADLNNVFIIGVDCPGTFLINTFSSYPGKGNPTEAVLNDEAEGYLRSACLNCKDPVVESADMVIGIFGADLKKNLILDVKTDNGNSLIKGMDLKVLKDDGKRKKAVDDIRKVKDGNREIFLKEKEEIKGADKLLEFFETCVNCHNCMKACPVCYCKECLFDSSVFDLEANKYMAKAKAKGAFKAPTDSLLFHITKFNHMILSCVECGLCEQACPSNIPLMDIITGIAENAQKEFGYTPGTDPEAPLPMVVYREEEFQDVGE